VTHSEFLPQYNLRKALKKNSYLTGRELRMKNPILTRSHGRRVARLLTQIGYRIALAATPLLAPGSAQLAVAPTTIQVTTTQQGVTDTSHCSLQEAIYAAEFASNTALNLTDPDRFYTTGCVLQGSTPPFAIVLQKTVYSFNTFWDRDAHNPFGLTATPLIFTNIFIQGNGATLQWTGTGNSRLFAVGTATIFDTLDNKTVSGTGDLSLDSVYIKGFKIKGGDGECGGGGGLGAGGAIYVGTVGSDVPSLVVKNSTFESNFAVGGKGGGSGAFCGDDSNPGGGGGGGGLSGNGGDKTDIGAGAGGGGSRGNGGAGRDFNNLGSLGGGGGGGTIFDGSDSTPTGGSGGYLCGGSGGGHLNSGHNATCPGGGGGGGGYNDAIVSLTASEDGADGAYGGGGGGAGLHLSDFTGGSGGNGGFGGGGGASGTRRSIVSGTHGGNGGFGGGAGSGVGTDVDSHGAPGNRGRFGGDGNGSCCGGGGGAVGGAIFNHGGVVVIQNSTFTHNDVDRGEGGVAVSGDRGSNGGDAGAAIFSMDGLLAVENATISDNFSTGSGGGIVVVADPLGAPASVTAEFILRNTIISRNGGDECLLEGTPDPINGHVGTVDAQGSGNLILANNGCPGVAVTTDPQLQALAVDKRSQTGTPTLALPSDSAAVNAGDDDHILPTDQRGIARPQGPHGDIGAFEFALPSANLGLTSQTSAAQIVAGGSFAYTVQLTNSGPDDAADVIFSDLPPAGVTFTSCTSTEGNCTITGGGASLNLATVPDGDTVTITIQATLSAIVTDGTTLTNAPSVTSSTSDPDTSNNSGSAGAVNIVVENKSDLQVTTQSNVDVINFGGTLTYTVTVTNLGPFQASAVTMVDPVPAESIFLSMNSGGAFCTAPPPAMGGTVTCNFGNMPSGASATVSFTVRVSKLPIPASISNTVVVSSPNFDPNPANNSATVKTLVFGNKRL
jgi:uncharacterized repeat protein (TIGR01451 family)